MSYVYLGIAFILFWAVAYRPIKKLIIGMIDNRGDKIISDLTKARELRAEAQKILETVKEQANETETIAKQMLEDAANDVAQLKKQAERDIDAEIDRKLIDASERIARAEIVAMDNIRNKVSDIAMETVREILNDNMDSKTADKLIAGSINKLDKKLH